MKEKILEFPPSPGVYLMKDAKGEILYIGKAKNLRSRVLSYFSTERDERYQIQFLMKRVVEIEPILTVNEKEALLLEERLIKKYQPRYNLSWKDDKSYLSLKLNLEHPFPRLIPTRKIEKDGSLYFGPYPAGFKAREVVDFIERHFKLRTCSEMEFLNQVRPCLQYQIKRCDAPCVQLISQKAYREVVQQVRLFLQGKNRDLIKSLKSQMDQASENLRYEEAARLRDLIHAIQVTLEKQKVVSHFAPDREWIGFDRERKEIDERAREKILIGLQEKLHLSKFPRRIECYDISNLQGKNAVGSMVCFVDARPDKSSYRKFKIKTVHQANDFAMLYEVLNRRFGQENWPLPDLIVVDGGKGQLGAARAALRDKNVLNVDLVALAKEKEKKPERIFLLHRKDPILLPSNSPELHLLVHLRDEAHRFGITIHRHLRGKRALSSVLDDIEGIGPSRKKNLLSAFGTVQKMREASLEELSKPRGMNLRLAERVHEKLRHP